MLKRGFYGLGHEYENNAYKFSPNHKYISDKYIVALRDVIFVSINKSVALLFNKLGMKHFEP